MRANGTTLAKALELAPFTPFTPTDAVMLAAGWLAEPVARFDSGGRARDPMHPAWVLVDREALTRYRDAYQRLASSARDGRARTADELAIQCALAGQ